MIVDIGPKTGVLPVSLDEAKEHLRISDNSRDTEVRAALEAAVDYCEQFIARTLRVSQTVVQSTRVLCWLEALYRQPVKAITSITYYDADNEQQTVDPAQYRLVTQHGASVLEVDKDFAWPTVFARDDAWAVTYVAGYVAISDVPPQVKYAIREQLRLAHGDVEPAKRAVVQTCVDNLLYTADWGAYR